MKLMNVLAGVVAAAMLIGCGGKSGKRTDPGLDQPVKVSVVKDKVNLNDLATAKVVELECQNNKNLLLIVAKDSGEELTMSRQLKVAGQSVRFNPAKENQRLVLFVQGQTADQAATHMLNCENYADTRSKCEKGALSTVEIYQIFKKAE